jgi:putative tricarboxylic transport membrane protein
MFVFGLLGWALRRWGFPIAPLVLGLILGRMAEENLRRALIVSEGSWLIFVKQPLSLTLLLLAFSSVVFSIWQNYRSARSQQTKNPA